MELVQIFANPDLITTVMEAASDSDRCVLDVHSSSIALTNHKYALLEFEDG